MDSKTKLELGWGNPDFLQPYWEAHPINLNIDLNEQLAYQFTGLEDLKISIKKLHKKIGNANVDNKYIVIGSGATHILNGLISMHSSPLVYAEPPCYHKFYEFTNFANKTWAQHENSIEIVTIPNNPDGQIKKGTSKFQVHDLSYNWPTYGRIENYDFDIMIFGLSKATGHASTRIGWAIIKDEEVAKQLEYWMHINSCGVSYYSQLAANKIIKNQALIKDTVFKYGEEVIIERWKDIMFSMNLPFERQNGNGMFMWCKGECPEDLTVVPGKLFGGPDDHFRISLGVSEETWQEFVRRFAK